MRQLRRDERVQLMRFSLRVLVDPDNGAEWLELRWNGKCVKLWPWNIAARYERAEFAHGNWLSR